MSKNLSNSKNYKNSVKSYQPTPSYFSNCVKAFLVGGFICVIGQVISNLYIHFFDFTEKTVGNATVPTLIFIAALLTGFGIYDKIGQFGGAGSLVPVTGFSNSVASAALEHKSEGLVLGVATKLFKLAGAVIVFGVVSAYIVGMIRMLFKMLIS